MKYLIPLLLLLPVCAVAQDARPVPMNITEQHLVLCTLGAVRLEQQLADAKAKIAHLEKAMKAQKK